METKNKMADIISEYEDRLPPKIIGEAREAIAKGVSDSKVRKIMEAISAEFIDSKVCPGESVGLIAGPYFFLEV